MFDPVIKSGDWMEDAQSGEWVLVEIERTEQGVRVLFNGETKFFRYKYPWPNVNAEAMNGKQVFA